MSQAAIEHHPRLGFQAITLYALMIAAAVAIFFAVRAYGETLTAPPAGEGAAAAAKAAQPVSHALLHVLLALVVVIVAGRLLGWVFKWLHQPPVIGEVLAGILIGPSLLGRVAPGIAQYIMPAGVAPYLAIVAQLGVLLYMFTVGLEFDAAVLRRKGHSVVAISHASIVVPFILGAVLALAIYPVLSTQEWNFTPFALFLGVSMSVTAFPVLARILTDRGMHRTELGMMALACAAADDVTAWCLLAFVVGVAKAEVGGAVMAMLFTMGYIVAMFLIVRPLLVRCLPKQIGPLSQGLVAAVFVGLLLSAWLTEFIGIHAIFGAFLFGAAIPHDSAVAHEFGRKLEDLVGVVLLPAFFAITGLRTEIALVSGWENWLWCGLIVLVATAGKFGGSFAAARLSGMPWRDSAALGLMMNTRGLMELIVLNIGLDLGVITPRLFAMLVIMALVTTLATTPLLTLLEPRKPELTSR